VGTKKVSFTNKSGQLWEFVGVPGGVTMKPMAQFNASEFKLLYSGIHGLDVKLKSSVGRDSSDATQYDSINFAPILDTAASLSIPTSSTGHLYFRSRSKWLQSI
jgi:hypothetical protein